MLPAACCLLAWQPDWLSVSLFVCLFGCLLCSSSLSLSWFWFWSSWLSLLLSIFACVCAFAHSFLQLFFEFPFWTRYVLSNCATRMSQRLHMVTRVWLCRGMRVHWLDYQHSQRSLSYIVFLLPTLAINVKGAMRHKTEQWTKAKLAFK